MNSRIILSVPNIIIIQLFIWNNSFHWWVLFFLTFFFVDTMNYCYIGTEIIIHCINKEIFSILFSLSDGSLLSDTEKLCFLLKRKTKRLKRFVHDTCQFTVKYCWPNQWAWSHLRYQQARQSFSVRARVDH